MGKVSPGFTLKLGSTDTLTLLSQDWAKICFGETYDPLINRAIIRKESLKNFNFIVLIFIIIFMNQLYYKTKTS